MTLDIDVSKTLICFPLIAITLHKYTCMYTLVVKKVVYVHIDTYNELKSL